MHNLQGARPLLTTSIDEEEDALARGAFDGVDVDAVLVRDMALCQELPPPDPELYQGVDDRLGDLGLLLDLEMRVDEDHSPAWRLFWAVHLQVGKQLPDGAAHRIPASKHQLVWTWQTWSHLRHP